MLRSNDSNSYQIIAQKCNVKELTHVKDVIFQVIKISVL